MKLEGVFNFGKYRGCFLKTIIEEDPFYIKWACDNDLIELEDAEAIKIYIQSLQSERTRRFDKCDNPDWSDGLDCAPDYSELC
jgi:hypothetical protein